MTDTKERTESKERIEFMADELHRFIIQAKTLSGIVQMIAIRNEPVLTKQDRDLLSNAADSMETLCEISDRFVKCFRNTLSKKPEDKKSEDKN